MNNSLLEIRVFIRSVHLNFTLGFNASLKHNWWKVSWTIGVSFTNPRMGGFFAHLNKASKQFFESWFNAHLMGAPNNILMILFSICEALKYIFFNFSYHIFVYRKLWTWTLYEVHILLNAYNYLPMNLKMLKYMNFFLISNYQFF
jgi:hypothetical protein